MADELFELIKKRLRIASSAFDDDIQMHIRAAKRRIEVTGVKLGADEKDRMDPLLVDAITTYVRAHYAPDNEYSERYAASFESFMQFLTLSGEYNGKVE